jgi:hypothetical protein
MTGYGVKMLYDPIGFSHGADALITEVGLIGTFRTVVNLWLAPFFFKPFHLFPIAPEIIFIPESCMKINEKLGLYLKDEYHFISLLFTLWASRRLPSAALLRPRHSAL